METIDKIVQRVLTKRQSRQMSDAEFAGFIRELEAGGSLSVLHGVLAHKTPGGP